MGYYVETGNNYGKADYIVANYGGRRVSLNEARSAINDPNLAVISVKDNGLFEAAGFCYNQPEFDAFADPGDTRRTSWVIMDRETAKRLTGMK